MIIVSAVISAIATIVIAYFTWQTHKMYLKIQEKDEEHKEQTRDLYQAIVVATLLSGPSSYGAFNQCKDAFNATYSGKTEIFKN
ncbi:MAG: hypothetical protein ABIH85_07335 [Candidatus Omnitrophota bacterium]